MCAELGGGLYSYVECDKDNYYLLECTDPECQHCVQQKAPLGCNGNSFNKCYM